MSSSWIAEGVSARIRWGHPSPVVHLIVVERQELWCTGSRGRVASIHHSVTPGYPAPRACRTCRDLAAAAVAEEMADPSELDRFAPPAPT